MTRLDPAPLYHDIARGPDGGQALFLHAADGMRLRIAHWPAGQARGTALVFPGRTEYVEKYGPVAANLTAAGWHAVAVDWRGQGLSDRPVFDRNAGHVVDFAEYQRDIAAVLGAVRALGLPEPSVLLSHSMGGCIALRWLMAGDQPPVRAAAFSAPMWGIGMKPWQRPFAPFIAWAAVTFGRGQTYAPGTGPAPYLGNAPAASNMLTTDAETYAWMQDQLRRRPELSLGGPDMFWLHAALRETAALARLPSPALPVVVGLGTDETVVHPAAIHARMARWPDARFEVIPEARHELLMERPALRGRFIEAATELFR